MIGFEQMTNIQKQDAYRRRLFVSPKPEAVTVENYVITIRWDKESEDRDEQLRRK